MTKTKRQKMYQIESFAKKDLRGNPLQLKAIIRKETDNNDRQIKPVIPKGNQDIHITIEKDKSSNSGHWNTPQSRPIEGNLPV